MPMMFFPGNTSIKCQPKGIVLIIGSDRNPVGSILCPLVTAVASGNGVIVRPTDSASKCAKALTSFFANFLDNRFYRCVAGPDPRVEELSSLAFDMICFTGEEEKAKKVLLAASSNLVPVHLELENTCPTVVDSSADVSMAAAK